MAKNDMPIKHTFKGAGEGKNVLIFGAVHGDETCGVEAIHAVMDEIKESKLLLKAGSVTFVPIANPLAHEQGKRFVDQNLNRLFYKHSNPSKYEEHVANALYPMFGGMDYFLDIHSTLKASEPFSLTVGMKEEHELANVLGCETNVYLPDNAGRGEANLSYFYGERQNVKSILIECGQHKDPNAIQAAKQSIYNTLSHAGIIDKDWAPIAKGERHSYDVKKIYYNDEVKSYNGALPKPMQPFGQGEVIAHLNNGSDVLAPVDGTVLLFPNEGKQSGYPEGAEQFYLATPRL